MLQRNATDLAMPGASVRRQRVERFLTGPPTAYDLVLLDPPYSLDVDPVLSLLEPWAGDRVVLERDRHGAPPSWPAALAPATPRRYGDTVVIIAERRAVASPGVIAR